MQLLKEEFGFDENMSREFGRFFDENADKLWVAECPAGSVVEALGVKPGTKQYYQAKYVDVATAAQEAFIKHKGWEVV